jgi:hypothetical protein
MHDGPRADARALSLTCRKFWTLRTEHPRKYVVSPGFFDSCLTSGIEIDDEIAVIATGDEPAWHGTLVIDEIGGGAGPLVKASVLYEHRRAR